LASCFLIEIGSKFHYYCCFNWFSHFKIFHFCHFNQEELTALDPKLFVPYWNWLDANSTKAVFSPDFMGSPVQAPPGNYNGKV
jgi:hypothetical protein